MLILRFLPLSISGRQFSTSKPEPFAGGQKKEIVSVDHCRENINSFEPKRRIRFNQSSISNHPKRWYLRRFIRATLYILVARIFHLSLIAAGSTSVIEFFSTETKRNFCSVILNSIQATRNKLPGNDFHRTSTCRFFSFPSLFYIQDTTFTGIDKNLLTARSVSYQITRNTLIRDDFF